MTIESTRGPQVRENALRAIREGTSVSQAARDAGVARGTMHKWMDEAGMQRSNPTPTYTPRIRAEAIGRIKRGASYREVTEATGASASQIRRWVQADTKNRHEEPSDPPDPPATRENPENQDRNASTSRASTAVRYDARVRAEAIGRIRSGEAYRDVEEATGVSASQIRRWVRADERDRKMHAQSLIALDVLKTEHWLTPRNAADRRKGESLEPPSSTAIIVAVAMQETSRSLAERTGTDPVAPEDMFNDFLERAHAHRRTIRTATVIEAIAAATPCEARQAEPPIGLVILALALGEVAKESKETPCQLFDRWMRIAHDVYQTAGETLRLADRQYEEPPAEQDGDVKKHDPTGTIGANGGDKVST